jgi:5-hydroxyisourate hydrolase
MSGITTHVLDVALGRPAAGVPVRLEVHRGAEGWVTLAERVTDDDGRVRDFIPAGSRLDPARYRLTFMTANYQRVSGEKRFYPEVPIVFEVADPAQNYHVPLLLSPFGYSTYRGS